MNKFNFSRIHSSWNVDRVGSCVASKPHKVRAARKSYLYAQYCGNEVCVCGARGKVRFVFKFDQIVVSAIIRDGYLIIETTDKCVRHYDVSTRKLVSESWPTPLKGSLVVTAYSLAA